MDELSNPDPGNSQCTQRWNISARGILLQRARTVLFRQSTKQWAARPENSRAEIRQHQKDKSLHNESLFCPKRWQVFKSRKMSWGTFWSIRLTRFHYCHGNEMACCELVERLDPTSLKRSSWCLLEASVLFSAFLHILSIEHSRPLMQS